VIDILKGLVNNPDPTILTDGTAYVSTNSRIDREGYWSKGAKLSALTTTIDVDLALDSVSPEFCQAVNVLGVAKIARGLKQSTTIASGSNGYAYYANTNAYYWTGSAVGSAGLAAPSQDTYPSVTVSGIGARQESGIYMYFHTLYDPARDIESLPSPAIEHWVNKYYVNDTRQADIPVLGAVDTEATYKVRWYRSKVIKVEKGDTKQLGQKNSLTEFYYVGEAADNVAYTDYAHDSELGQMFVGRGSVPPTSIDSLASYNGRMFYFKDNVSYFSSVGRPDEVPVNYSFKIRHDYSVGAWSGGTFKDQLVAATSGDVVYTTLTMKPTLDTGIVAEAKMTINELAGKTVLRAIEYGGKLWVFTVGKTGYITQTAEEGYKYTHVADGIGISGAQCLTTSPYGLFGADSKGLWQITDGPKRLSEGIIDIADTAKDTYLNTSDTDRRWVSWIPEGDEVWFGGYKASASDNVQIVYQADRGSFAGPYSLDIESACYFNDGGQDTSFIWDDQSHYYADYSSRTGVQSLQFWFGGDVTDKVNIDVLYKSITAAQTITARLYQGKTASSDFTSNTFSHTSGNLVGKTVSHNSGRYFGIDLSIPSACTAPILGIDFTADLVPKKERHGR